AWPKHDSSMDQGQAKHDPSKAQASPLVPCTLYPVPDTSSNTAASCDTSESFILSPDSKQADPVILTFPCAGPVPEWDLRESRIAVYQESYPGVDVLLEAKRAKLWIEDNPRKKKTATGMRSFLTNWMKNAQDKANRSISEKGGKREKYARTG